MSIENFARAAIPFRVALTQTFRATHERVGLLIEGPSGWGEFAPFSDYSPALAGRWLAAALESACGLWPTPLRSQIPINAIIPATSSERAYEMAREAITTSGMSTFKVKVGQGSHSTVASDMQRIEGVLRACAELGITGVLRIDANAAWTVGQAIDSVARICEVVGSLDYIEQPCATLEELHDFRAATGIRVAVDESIRLAESLDGESIRAVADLMIVKSIPLGGVQRALDVIDEVNLPVVVSGSMDTSIGLMSGLALAAVVPELYGACGLGTGVLLKDDVVSQTHKPHAGLLSVNRTFPDDECLHRAKTRVTPDERDAWVARMIAAWEATGRDLVTAEVRHMVEQW